MIPGYTLIFHRSATVWDDPNKMMTDGSATSLGPSTGVEGFAFAPGTPASSQDVEDASAASEDEEEEVREDENEVGIFPKTLEEKEMET